MFNFKNIKDSFSLAVIYWVFTVLIAVAFMSPGASGSAGVGSGPGTTEKLSTTFPMTVTDDLGRTITIDKVPQRIVSLEPSNTEILFDLGLSDKVVGDTSDANYPAAAAAVTHVGSYSDIDVEKVVSLQPDLILAEDIDKSTIIPALEQLGYNVYAVVPHNLDEIVYSVSTIGRLTGSNAAAKTIVSDMQSRIKVITDKTANLMAVQKPSVLYVIWQDPIMSSGTDTPIWDMIDKAGGANVCPAVTGFPTISLESVIADNPQIVICNVDTSYPGGDAPLVFFQTEAQLQRIAAAKSGKVYGIDASLTNQPVPRIIGGLEWMAAMIHPELFPQFVAEYMSAPFPAATTTATN